MRFNLTLPGALLLGALVFPAQLPAQKFYTYVGDLSSTHVLLAWGTTAGENTIGRSSPSHGKANVRVGTQEVQVTDKNWTVISGLQPNTEYEYEVRLNNAKIGGAKIRTWPDRSDKLRFFVIGDYGTGDRNQLRVAEAMWAEFQRLAGDNPVRFVITTGDNLYGTLGLTLRFRDTGDEDSEWESKFYRPYEPVLARIPFYPSLGNHDGNETESRGDLAALLDNFFFPSPQPARYYRFTYAGFADFFALDSTSNSEKGPARPLFLKDGDQHKWLAKNLGESRVPWKIPFMHHPPYNSGPRHPAARNDIPHFLQLFQQHGVRVVFTGHEHNFQYSKANRETGDVRYVVSGSGGELRTGDVRGEMDRAHIEGWSAQLQFLSVEIEGREMRITPVSFEPVQVVDRNGGRVAMPLKVSAP